MTIQYHSKRNRNAIFVGGWIFLITGMLSCAVWKPSENNPKGYRLDEPEYVRILPADLHEISGITQIAGDTFACIQDEEGIVFLLDVKNGKIIKRLPFFGDGDYEGIARVGKSLYILRSDGLLFEIPDFTSPEYGHLTYETGIPANNNEGLCYDASHNRLLIACKSNIGKGAAYKNVRAIYAFDLTTKKLSEEPVIELNIEELQNYALSHDMDLPQKKSKHKKKESEPDIKFRTSAIAVHPETQQIYLLSAIDHFMCILSPEGNLVSLIKLDETIFNKSEGLFFANDLSMLITNEGQDKHPTLVSFTYHKRR